ncbi:DNA-binding protein [Aphanothece hegewaldii CCALA 016]|uniref:DNA-binding protein n=1 Tax=Aphanothece hegewaldii CCALA 016 TaxID=2107694 RepID=A0A2T1LXQ5_9CHRO|nr:ribbon-helix-helix protein, CopG family [Aphanothece hegewaldii]PSF37159.1 DNA-binding protein [Aphanothece hegewaldii CCALA 016]
MANQFKASEKGTKIRLTLDVSQELNNTLNELADDGNTTKSDILRRAIALMEIAVKAQKEGGKVMLVNNDKSETKEIVGLY